MFEQLPDIHVESSKHEPFPSVNVLNINATIMKNENDENKKIKLSLSTKELIHAQNNHTFSYFLFYYIKVNK